ncbi:MAG: lipocalin family protein [Maritimibacter sp.]|nr:lipocalin family protein [Maritimibacter sp.]
MRLFTALCALAAAFGVSACSSSSYRDTSQPMQAVDDLDLARYLGLWYEIARFPNRFEQGCAGVTAEYGQRPDGKITVVNTCHKGSPDGPVETAEGVAEVVAPGKLKVSFVPWLPFARGDYWVLHVDPGYSVAVVGEPSGRTGWILARTSTIEPEIYDKGISVLRAMGYDTSQMQRVAQ